jgi:hypothetical protein
MAQSSDENYVKPLVVLDENGQPMTVKCTATGELYVMKSVEAMSPPVTPNRVSDDNYVKAAVFEDENGLPEHTRASLNGTLYVISI